MANAPIALVGGESLLGADVRERLADELPGLKVKLIGSEDEHAAILTEQAGELVVMTGLDEETIATARVLILAGSAPASKRALELVGKTGAVPLIVDLTGALEDLPEARLRAPWIEAEKGSTPENSRIQVLAHPAAIVLGRFFCHCADLRHPNVTVLVPASEKGKPGVNELHRQAIELLKFQKPPTEVFGDQLCFNFIGAGMRPLEERIEKHLASFELMASVRAIQAPVMHGYGFSIWLDGAKPDLRGLDFWPDDPPTLVGVAGQDGMAIGRAEEGWAWIAADQFRVATENLIELLKAAV